MFSPVLVYIVVVRSNDTDVFVLLLHHLKNIQMETSIWMDAGHSSLNTRQNPNIHEIASSLRPEILDAVSGFHAFKGCDTTAAFEQGKLETF